MKFETIWIDKLYADSGLLRCNQQSQQNLNNKLMQTLTWICWIQILSELANDRLVRSDNG